MPPPAKLDGGVGVYVHFPWCRKKCPYCDFLSIAADPASLPHEQYASAVLTELKARVPADTKVPLRSIFFGGGTPSLWKSGQLGRVLAGILTAFHAKSADVEITVECNPTHFDEPKARSLLDVEVNRISLGIQALDADRLAFLGRWHSAQEGLSAVRAAVRSGMPRVSSDLIYGVNAQSPQTAANEVKQIAQLGVSHLSAYALTIEPQTAFGALARKGRLPLARDSAVADSFLQVSDTLQSQGFAHYEISNFARDGHVSDHNLGYWRGRDYLGLGCGAFGTIRTANSPAVTGLRSPAPDQQPGRFRYRNLAHPEKYISAALALDVDVPKLNTITSSLEPISDSIALTEAIMLGLRIAEGLDPEALSVQTGASFWTAGRKCEVTRLLARGQLQRRDHHLCIPREHWLLADGIIRDLM